MLCPAVHDTGFTFAQALHGDIAQSTREKTLEDFRKGRIQVLVATDVAARGLDIPEVCSYVAAACAYDVFVLTIARPANQVPLVVQMEPPRELESYIHRSGRTGRAGKSGTCITMYSDVSSVRGLEGIERHIGVKVNVRAASLCPNAHIDTFRSHADHAHWSTSAARYCDVAGVASPALAGPGERNCGAVVHGRGALPGRGAGARACLG